jgi:hypothetical protein
MPSLALCSADIPLHPSKRSTGPITSASRILLKRNEHSGRWSVSTGSAVMKRQSYQRRSPRLERNSSWRKFERIPKPFPAMWSTERMAGVLAAVDARDCKSHLAGVPETGDSDVPVGFMLYSASSRR